TDRAARSLALRLFPANDDVLLAQAYVQLGNALADEEKVDEAIENYKKSVAIHSAILGKDSYPCRVWLNVLRQISCSFQSPHPLSLHRPARCRVERTPGQEARRHWQGKDAKQASVLLGRF